MINTLKPALGLLNFNLHWHAQVIKDTLIRYKIFVLFIILTLVPTVSGIHYILILPTKSLFSPSATTMQYMISLSAYLGIGLIWLLIQKNIISNQSWDKYLITLPLTNIQKTIYEAITLVVANSLIWIPLLLAAYTQTNSDWTNTLIILGKTLTYIALVVLFQLTWKTKNFAIMALAAFLELPILCGAQRFGTSTQVISLCISIALSLLLMQMCFSIRAKTTPSLVNENTSNENFHANLGANFAFTSIQIKNLWEINADLVMMAIAILAVYSIAFCLMKYAQDNGKFTSIISSLMLVNAVIISNLFVKMSTQRNQLFPYLASLPISKSGLFGKDLAVAGLCLVTINTLIFITGMFFLNDLLSVSELMKIFIMPMVLLGLSYFPQLRFAKYGFFMSLTIMSFFIWCNYSLFTASR